jgi:myo-inositol-1-phosphate synthase
LGDFDMMRTRVFEIIEGRGQKQRWLLSQLRSRGYKVSESYLSQIKSGAKEPTPQFIEAVCAVLGIPETELFTGKERTPIMKGQNVKRTAVRPAGRRGAGPGRGKINVAIVGVGNCASSLVQGRYFYEDAQEGQFIPGLMHANLGGYHIRDINFVAAIDIDQNKVGKDLSAAIFTAPNNTIKISDVPDQGVRVARGMTHDGLGKYLSQIIKKSKGGTEDIVKLLRDTHAHVVINYLPVGSEEATKWYVEQVLAAGCGFVNCIPVFIARDQYGYWPRRFREAGLPIIGDDIKSQVGATIVHRVLTRLFRERGVRLERTYQLNFGGNTDFLNMLERERLESKKISKTCAVTSQLDYELPASDVHVGPSDYVPWLTDRKFCYIRMEGTTFGNVPLNAEVKLEVWDSPNSAGVVLDAIRCCKIALDRGIAGPLLGPSSYFMKSPPEQYADDVAHDKVEEFIRG